MSALSNSSLGAGTNSATTDNTNMVCSVPDDGATDVPACISAAQITQLQEFHLRLVAHPRILVCTRPNCGYGLALVPLVKEIMAHIKQFHSYALDDGQQAKLTPLLQELDLELPSVVELKKELLPVLYIPELAGSYGGRHCTVCTYSIKSKSAMNSHVQQHTYADGASKYHCNDAIQLFWENAQNYRRYVHATHPTLVPLPLPAALSTAMSTDKLDNAAKAKVSTLLQTDKELLHSAGLLTPQIQPQEYTGNLGPWARALDWQMYWAGKPITALGLLRGEPKNWRGAHRYGAHWVYAAGKKVAVEWMSGLLSSSRTTQALFHAHGPNASKPYSLNKDTVRKRAELWAHVLALLFHLFFDGNDAGYYGKATPYAHHGLDAELEDALLQLRDFYCGVEEEDGGANPVVTEEAEALLLQLSVLLVTQEPVDFGHTEQLTLSRLFLHLCVSADGTLKPVSAATSAIAALEFCIRSVLHEHLLHAEHGLLAHQDAAGKMAEVDSILQQYAYHNSHSASAHLQSLHCFGSALAHDDGSSFAFHWSKDLATVTFGLEEIAVERLPALMHGTLQQADQRLAELRLLANAKEANMVDLALVQDNICNMRPGFSVADACLEPPTLPSVLCRAVTGSAPAASLPLLDAYSKEVRLDRTAAQAYFALHDEFTKLLAVLIELSSGLPARGTELVQLQHTNTLLGPRNVFVHDGSVFTALPSNKGTGRQKIIPRFLPHAVGCLVVFYVCQVVPFVHLLYNATVQPRESSAMLLVDHAGKPWDTTTISKMLQSLCKQYLSPSSAGLTMRTWRQLAVSIDRKLIRPKKVTAEELEDHTHDLQAGHSTRTAQQHYGLDASMLHQLHEETMTAMLEVSERWHAFWQLPTRFQEKVAQLVPASTASSNGEAVKAIHALKRQLDAFQEDVRSIKQKLEHSAPASLQAGASRGSRSAVVPAVVCQALYKVTGSRCTKTVEQAYALNAIHRRESPLIIVMATGSGKSALFLAPLHWLLLSSVVVVVVPYVALMEDLLRQSNSAGIAASKWVGYRCADKVEGSQLVFVAAENCYSEPFSNWIQSLQRQERLAAVFFDECHVALTQVHFRPGMDKIKWLVSQVKVPQYFLTATLPPSLVASFQTALLLPQDGTGLLRAATNRKNIAYVVKLVASAQEKRLQLQHLLQQHASGPVMVFCKAKEEAAAVAGDLGCACITADMDAQSKMELVQAWLQCAAAEMLPSKRILVGTSAIGTGIHPLHVQLVVHYSDAWDLISYAQESGRAGRSGGAATAVLLANKHSRLEAQVQEYVQEQTCRRIALSTYLDGMPIHCLSQPDLALCDLCKPEAEEPTTPPLKVLALESPPLSEKRPCHASSSSSRLPSNTVNSSSSTTCLPQLQESEEPLSLQLSVSSGLLLPPTPPMADTSSIKALLDSFTSTCSLCYLFCRQHTCMQPEGIQHRFVSCHCWPQLPRSLGAKINASVLGPIRAQMRKDPHVACFSCLVPIDICNSSRSNAGIKCSRRYADIVLPVVVAVLRREDHCRTVLQQLGLQKMDVKAVGSALGSAVVYKGERVFLAFALFAAAVEAVV
ncbi:hypothetical protein [Sporisorium scitamineum]|uniref:DNA 3'-5' helicase n=1 Tax=Sporisorium scitamineum TaxID=49012 RepID=A0A0F7RUS5_9BASI|nr:hypothetical protein [Sporisorium scitamineum]